MRRRAHILAAVAAAVLALVALARPTQREELRCWQNHSGVEECARGTNTEKTRRIIDILQQRDPGGDIRL